MKIYIYILAMCFSLESLAQSRILPITEVGSSPQSLSLGGVTLGNLNGAYIYNNPSTVFNIERASAEYSMGVIEGFSQNNLLQSLTAAYREGKHAILLGGKYLSMGKIGTLVDEDINYSSSAKKMYSYIVNVGYAYQIDRKFSVYSTVGYIQERTVVKIQGYQFNVGASYANSMSLFNRNAHYIVGGVIGNVGQYNYDQTKGMIAPIAKVGGSIATHISNNHTVELFADLGWYLPTDNTEVSPFQALGVGYKLFNRYCINLGGSFQDGTNYMSTGIGFSVAFLEFNVAAKIPMETRLGNVYMCGVKFVL